jgi:hypothetical protein
MLVSVDLGSWASVLSRNTKLPPVSDPLARNIVERRSSGA